MKRRLFIGSVGALSGGLLLGRTESLIASAGVPSPMTPMTPMLFPPDSDDRFWRRVRQHFVYPGDYIYLNTGGIGAVPKPVLQRVEAEMKREQMAPRPGHDHEFWNGLKTTLSGFLGPDCLDSEIALTGTTTEGINIIISGLRLKEGDEIITTTHEHAALHVPLLNQKRLNGVKIRFFEPDRESGAQCVQQVADLITPKTRLIFLSHVTCTTGYRLPVEEIGQLARDRGILFALDGAQAVGSIPVDLSRIPVDFYAGCGHKWLLAPKHTGFLWLKKDRMPLVEPMSVGAYSDDGFDIRKGELTFQDSATRYEYGTQNEACFKGFATALELLQTIGIDRIFQHNRLLAEQFVAGLRSIPAVTLLSPEEEQFRSSLVTFQIRDKDYTDVAHLLGKNKIRVRVVPEAGVNGVRASFHLYNQTHEVDQLLREITNISRS